MNKPNRIIPLFISLLLCLNCLSIVRSVGSLYTDKRITSFGTIIDSSYNYMKSFHTGAPAWEYVYNTTSYGDSLYHVWDTARPYVNYAQIQGAAILLDDGTIVPTAYLDVSWEGIVRQLTAILDSGKFPILEFFLTNFANVTESGLRSFLTKLSNWLGNSSVIFDPCWEYNFASNMTGWGDKGDGSTFKVVAADYNGKMRLIRMILDQEDIRNIYLASHANLLFSIEQGGIWSDNPNFEGVVEYLDGMRQADVVGFSHYYNDLSASWKRAETIYEMINTSKPFIWFEYAPESPWSTKQNVTAQFVNDSYAMLETYHFVKGVSWYFGPYCTAETITAIRQNAEKYEGTT